MRQNKAAKCPIARLALLGVIIGLALASSAGAATITYAGADLTTHGAWRTADVSKPLDADGNNVYGTDGYALAESPGGSVIQSPTYLSGVVNLVNFFNGGFLTRPNYTSVDNPTGTGTVITGTYYASSASGVEDDLVRLTLSAATSFRMGILVDNHDFIDLSPSSLRVRQTAGGTADSGLKTSNLQPDLNSDWYFFDISGVAGDQFTLSGVNWYNGSPAQSTDGIGGLSFDSITNVPEPASAALVLVGLAGLAAGRRPRARP